MDDQMTVSNIVPLDCSMAHDLTLVGRPPGNHETSPNFSTLNLGYGKVDNLPQNHAVFGQDYYQSQSNVAG